MNRDRVWRLVWMLLTVLLVACGGNKDVSPPPDSPALVAFPTMTMAPTIAYGTPLPTPEPPTVTPELVVEPTTPPPTPVPLIQHVVQPGDTLLGLASAFNVPMAAIQLQNGLGASTNLISGQAIEIPPNTGWQGASLFWTVYEVSAGDTLYGIAEQYGLEAEAIQAVNGLGDMDLLVLGEPLILPLNTLGAAVVPTSTPVPPSPVQPEPTAAGEEPVEVAAVDTPVPTVPVNMDPPPPPDNIAAWPQEVARLINEQRAQYGLPPFVYNETLALAAQVHANDCLQRGWCSHTGSDGSGAKDRILRAGYDAALWGWAECWAQHQSPGEAVYVWMDEVPPNDPHRRTLLSTHLTEIGVGVAKTDWGYYFIADFGRR